MQGADAPKRDLHDTLWSLISSTSQMEKNAANPKTRGQTVQLMQGFIDRMPGMAAAVDALPIIHVAGSKGKGSTCAFVESILRAKGLKTGLFTSPHLVDVSERFRLDGRPVAPAVLEEHFWWVWDTLHAEREAERAAAHTAAQGAQADGAGAGEDDGAGEDGGAGEAGEVGEVGEVGAAVAGIPNTAPTYFNASGVPAERPPVPNFFRFLTLVALRTFVKSGVDVAILEVGLGGRLDATNVVRRPAVCGISMLDLEHTKILGDTIDLIAKEKCGIIKAGVPVITVPQQRAATEVIEGVANDLGAPLILATPLDDLRDEEGGEEGGENEGGGEGGESKEASKGAAEGGGKRAVRLGLPGHFQHENAALAVQLCHYFLEHRRRQAQSQSQAPLPPIMPTDILPLAFRRGLENCRWPGRAQCFPLPPVSATASAAAAADDDDDNDNDNSPPSPSIPSSLSSSSSSPSPSPSSFPGGQIRLWLDGAHTGVSVQMCLEWYAEQVALKEGAAGSTGRTSNGNGNVTAAGNENTANTSIRALIFHTGHERDTGALLAPFVASNLFDHVIFAPVVSRPSRYAEPPPVDILEKACARKGNGDACGVAERVVGEQAAERQRIEAAHAAAEAAKIADAGHWQEVLSRPAVQARCGGSTEGEAGGGAEGRAGGGVVLGEGLMHWPTTLEQVWHAFGEDPVATKSAIAPRHGIPASSGVGGGGAPVAAERARGHHCTSHVVGSLAEAVEKVRELAAGSGGGGAGEGGEEKEIKADGLGGISGGGSTVEVLVTGSLYLVGGMLKEAGWSPQDDIVEVDS